MEVVESSARPREPRFELLDERQAAIYRTWTPARRLKAVDDEMRFVRLLLAGVVASQHPDWEEGEVQREIARRILGHPG